VPLSDAEEIFTIHVLYDTHKLYGRLRARRQFVILK
jgi:hypothetical protein